ATGAGVAGVGVRRTLRTGAERRGAALAVAGVLGAACATGVAIPVAGADPPPPEERFAAGATRCVRTMFGAADRTTGDAEPPVVAAAEAAEPGAGSSLSRPCVTTSAPVPTTIVTAATAALPAS